MLASSSRASFTSRFDMIWTYPDRSHAATLLGAELESALEAHAERLRRSADRVAVGIETLRVLLPHGALARLASEAVPRVLQDADVLGRAVGLHLHLEHHEGMVDLLGVGLAREGAVVPVDRAEEARHAR